MTRAQAIAHLRSLFDFSQGVNPVALAAIALLAILGMGLFQLTSLNDKAMKGYSVNKLENERQELVRDGEITDMLILRARSYDNIQESEVVQGMRKPARDEVVYVTPVTVYAQR